ncbi:hypothetical protein [Fischerella sp. JS2]|nr:hypothetical protein [Fischerella sp. JS2]
MSNYKSGELVAPHTSNKQLPTAGYLLLKVRDIKFKIKQLLIL